MVFLIKAQYTITLKYNNSGTCNDNIHFNKQEKTDLDLMDGKLGI